METKVEVNVIRNSNFNNNQITEIKDDRGVKKYNRFRRFNVNKDTNEDNNNNVNNSNNNVSNKNNDTNNTNNNVYNNKNTEIRYSYYKKEVEPKKEIETKKEIEEEKPSFKRNVYRTKRAYNTNNNENKQEEKKEIVQEKKKLKYLGDIIEDIGKIKVQLMLENSILI